VVERPEVFLEPTAEIREDILRITKELYDYAKNHESYSVRTSDLKSLLVEGFDNDQIWEELQLQNEPLIKYLEKK